MIIRKIGVVVGAFVLVLLIWSQVMAVEEPAFKLALRDGAFELRDYPALIVAEVSVTGGRREAAGKGFRLLAGYIFGSNRRRQSIAMTAPVAQLPRNEKIAMTAPVGQIAQGDRWVVQFTMPAGYTMATLPIPTNPQVQLRPVAARRMAVWRFSGLAWQTDVNAKTALLQTALAKHRLRALGPAILAQYNPPWTLWFLRRNEVMVPVDGV